jgi:hypothetical protein
MADDDKKPVDHGDALNRFQRAQGNERQKAIELVETLQSDRITEDGTERLLEVFAEMDEIGALDDPELPPPH